MTSISARRKSDNIDPARCRPPCPDESARRLLKAIDGGDDSSMEVLYTRYEKDIFAFACSRLGDPHEAADIVNEVMLVAWRSAGRFRGTSRVRTWLLGIANNKAMDMLRRRSKWRHGDSFDDIPDPASDLGERIAANAKHHRCVMKCLGALSDEHRQVVHLVFFEGLSYGEIARIIDRPVGTVKSRMYHARISIKRCLEGMGVEGDCI